MTKISTQLKDINDQEIYLGDIVQTVWQDPLGVFHTDTVDENTYRVIIEGGMFQLQDTEDHRKIKPITTYVESEEGDYIPNFGYEVHYGTMAYVQKVV